RRWWAGGGAGLVHSFNLKEQKRSRTGPVEPDTGKESSSFKSGLLLDSAADTLYSLDINASTLSAIGLKDGEPVKTIPCGGRPYDIVKGRSGVLLYVSDWSGKAVLAVDPQELRVVAKITVAEHPNQMAVHPKDDRLFVACASSNCVSVIDTKAGVVTETIMTSLFPKAPEGTTPDALALSPDGKVLYVANADNNDIAVIDVAEPGKSQVKGFIPTGWYPTSVAVTPDGKNLLVGVGKGNQTKPNPIYKDEKTQE